MDAHVERLEYEVVTATAGKVTRTGMLIFRKAEDSPDGVACWERTSLLGGSHQKITFHRAELQVLARAALADAFRHPGEPWAVSTNRVNAALEGLSPQTPEEDVEEAQLDAALRVGKVGSYARDALDGLLARFVMSANPRAPGLPSINVDDYTALADAAFAAGEAMARKEEKLLSDPAPDGFSPTREGWVERVGMWQRRAEKAEAELKRMLGHRDDELQRAADLILASPHGKKVGGTLSQQVKGLLDLFDAAQARFVEERTAAEQRVADAHRAGVLKERERCALIARDKGAKETGLNDQLYREVADDIANDIETEEANAQADIPRVPEGSPLFMDTPPKLEGVRKFTDQQIGDLSMHSILTPISLQVLTPGQSAVLVAADEWERATAELQRVGSTDTGEATRVWMGAVGLAGAVRALREVQARAPAVTQALARAELEARPDIPCGPRGEVLFTGPPAALRINEETAVRTLMHLGWHIIGPDVPGEVSAVVRSGDDQHIIASVVQGLEELRLLRRPISQEVPAVLAAALRWFDAGPFLYEGPADEATEALFVAVKAWAMRGPAIATAMEPPSKTGQWLVLPDAARYMRFEPPERVNTVFDAYCVSHPDAQERGILVAEDAGGRQLAQRVAEALNRADQDRRQDAARAPVGQATPDGGLTEGVRWFTVGFRSGAGAPPQLTLQPIGRAGERLDIAGLTEFAERLARSKHLVRLVVDA